MTKKTLNNFFDGIYLINLPKDTDKLKRTQLEFDKYNINAKRIDALYGKNCAIRENDPKLDKLKDYQLKAIGCRESHILAYRDAIANGYSTVVHFEDDLKFHPEMENINKYLESVPDDWDFLWLGYYIHLGKSAKVLNESLKVNDYWYTATRWHSTHFMAYNLKSEKVRMIWDNIKDKYNYTHIDDYLCKQIKKHNANIYIPHPNLAVQNGETNRIEKIDLKKSNTIKKMKL